MGLPNLYTIRKRNIIGANLYLPNLLPKRKVKLYFIALPRFSRRGSFKLKKSKLNTKSRLLKLKKNVSTATPKGKEEAYSRSTKGAAGTKQD